LLNRPCRRHSVPAAAELSGCRKLIAEPDGSKSSASLAGKPFGKNAMMRIKGSVSTLDGQQLFAGEGWLTERPEEWRFGCQLSVDVKLPAVSTAIRYALQLEDGRYGEMFLDEVSSEDNSIGFEGIGNLG
jgi:hypothetical protein